jgi:ribonuclease HI
VYTDGSWYNNRKPYAQAGAGIFWGINSSRNKGVQVPGQQSNNRGNILAVLLALLSSDPCQSLMIFSDSEHAIRSLCYWAPNGLDLCKWR